MISEWFLGLLDTVGVWFFSLFPADAAITSFVSDASSVIQDAIDAANGLGAWLDWGYALLVSSIVASVWLIGLVIKVARWLLGLVPTMGGGT